MDFDLFALMGLVVVVFGIGKCADRGFDVLEKFADDCPCEEVETP